MVQADEAKQILDLFDKAVEAALSKFHGSGSDDIAAEREIAACRAQIATKLGVDILKPSL